VWPHRAVAAFYEAVGYEVVGSVPETRDLLRRFVARADVVQ
jgi:hypothetical protein